MFNWQINSQANWKYCTIFIHPDAHALTDPRPSFSHHYDHAINYRSLGNNARNCHFQWIHKQHRSNQPSFSVRLHLDIFSHNFSWWIFHYLAKVVPLYCHDMSFWWFLTDSCWMAVLPHLHQLLMHSVHLHKETQYCLIDRHSSSKLVVF